jgi:glycosyltransferase involved in cell wall biosynthesis
MRVAIVHNSYGRYSGEERAVEIQAAALASAGVDVIRFDRSSAGLEGSIGRQGVAFFSGIYSASAARSWSSFLDVQRPDVVHIHNLYPLISPSILAVCRARCLPVVMTVHNYRLVCPNGLLFSQGEQCDRCVGHTEVSCVLRNCAGSVPKSVGYALRSWAARKKEWFKNGVDAFLCLTEFQRTYLLRAGFDEAKVVVVAPGIAIPPLGSIATSRARPYVAYAGRLSWEKGFDLLLQAAVRLPDMEFRIAGVSSAGQAGLNIPPNVHMAGALPPADVNRFLVSAACCVVPSRCFEGFPFVLLESMALGVPVVAPRHGAFPEILQDGKNGYLFRTGDAESLAQALRDAMTTQAHTTTLGKNARAVVEEHFSLAAYVQRLLRVYSSVLT